LKAKSLQANAQRHCKQWTTEQRQTERQHLTAATQKADFGAQNCLPPLNLIRSTKLHLTTEPPISCRCCYKLPFQFSLFTF